MSTSFNPSVLFQQAIAYHQSGQLNTAIEVYKKLLARYPNNSGLLTNFGTALLQMGQYEESIGLLKKSLVLDANQPVAWSNQGIALKNLKKLKESLASFDCAIALQPNYADAYSNKGNTLIELGKFTEALDAFNKAISLRPDYADAYNNRGNALRELKKFDDAVDSFNKAISLRPDYADAYNNRGNALRELKKFDDAVDSFNKAISLRPDYADAYNNLSIIFHESKKFHQAIECANEAIKLNPAFADAYVCRGLAHHKLNQFDIALENFNLAIQLDPHNFSGHSNRGLALTKLNHFDEALASCNRAIELKPDYAEAYGNRGAVLCELHHFDEALASCNRAVELKPDFPEAYLCKGYVLSISFRKYSEGLDNFNKAIELKDQYTDAYWDKSLLKLLLGDYEEGWQLYEYRWKTDSQKSSARTYPQPLWLGNESLVNKTILIWSEQGLGDTIQFCRYIKMVSNLGAKVIFEVQEPLLESLSTLEGVSEMIPMGANTSRFDFHCPLLSLPLAFKTTSETIPNRIPYLSPDPNKVAYWRQKLGEKSNLRVGLVWSGGFRPDQPEVWSVNKRRNIPLIKLKSLNLPNIDFYSLQKGVEAEEELATLQSSGWNGPNIIDFTKELNDYSDTAALIANLDLVISVDTSVVHMTGAIGKPIWILNRFDTDWRWFVDRSDSLWYPTATIFNQPSYGDWDAVVDKVKSELLILTKVQ